MCPFMLPLNPHPDDPPPRPHPQPFEFTRDYSPMWNEILAHAHFVPELVALAESAIRHYEVDAGIAFPFDPLWDAYARSRPHRALLALSTPQHAWRATVDALLGGVGFLDVGGDGGVVDGCLEWRDDVRLDDVLSVCR